MFTKYLQLFSISWQNGFVYRASLFFWRLRSVMTTLLALTLWNTAFISGQVNLDYTQDTMILYIFLTAILQNIVLATALQGLTGTIYSGQLSIILLKPLNIFSFLMVQDLADKLKNVAFILIETAIFFLLFQPAVVWPTGNVLILFAIWIIGGLFINFLINLIFGAFGFWSPDSWGPRFLFYTLITFTSGTLYPLDILPLVIQKIIYLTPLPFLSFAQTQLFLNRLTSSEITTYSLGLIFWLFSLGLIARWLWGRGLRDYSAAGQ